MTPEPLTQLGRDADARGALCLALARRLAPDFSAKQIAEEADGILDSLEFMGYTVAPLKDDGVDELERLQP
jgi:hypothetical protein